MNSYSLSVHLEKSKKSQGTKPNRLIQQAHFGSPGERPLLFKVMSSRIDQFQVLVTKQPQNGLFRFSLAQALLSENRGEEAVPHLEFCVGQKADWMLPRILLGKELLASGNQVDAKSLFENALHLAIIQNHEDPAAELRALLASFHG